ncbi:MAG: PCMD domain-containing protein [Bacteroidetes bacterium]|nr:PCMD domain-containing protein [Bacteroidota bacterium]
MKQFILVISLVCSLTSCIKKAPLNPEADIETFTIDKTFLTGDVVIDQANRKILLYLQPEAYKNGIVPKIVVSNGATISPASGDSLKFGLPISYTVTSQSGINRKSYDVVVVMVGSWTFNFEWWGLNDPNKYEFPYGDDGSQVWSSGNPGIAITGVDKRPDAYPMRSTTDGYLGTKAAEIVTLPGNDVSKMIGIKIFPGSLFLGNFNSSSAMTNPPAATEFGQPIVGHPIRFTGYYKYAPGPLFQDSDGNTVNSMTDRCAVYAILFNGPQRLNGSNIQTSNTIVARAVLPDQSAKGDFTRFDIPFDYTAGALPGNQLMLAIVASSSAEGAAYRGAIGSRLVVDSLRIIMQ